MMTRAPENIPAEPRPATARPMIRATEVGAAPQTTKMVFRVKIEGVGVKLDYSPEPTSNMNIAVK